jgi:hypothetical protein
MHYITWYTGTCSIKAISLLYKFDSTNKHVYGCDLGFNGYFVTSAA